MAEIPALVREKIRRMIELLENDSIRIEKAILFGSYSTGKYDEWSDIDLALLSDDFTGNFYQDKLNLINYVYLAGTDLSPIPYRIEDFNNSIFAQSEILKHGIEIK